MKTSDLLLIGGLVGLGVWALSKSASAETETATGAAYPFVAETLTNSEPGAENGIKTLYSDAVASFLNSPSNSPASIKTGLNVINTALKEGISLPRTSGTIAKLGNNTNLARLADGSVKVVSVSQPKRDASGKTALDRLIEKNKAR